MLTKGFFFALELLTLVDETKLRKIKSLMKVKKKKGRKEGSE